jgi:hypothetical protein
MRRTETVSLSPAGERVGVRAVALLVLLSSPAFACAVCGGGYDPAKGSYVVMSAIISLLPLAMLGGILAWVIVRSRAADREAEQQDSSPPESVKS